MAEQLSATRSGRSIVMAYLHPRLTWQDWGADYSLGKEEADANSNESELVRNSNHLWRQERRTSRRF